MRTPGQSNLTKVLWFLLAATLVLLVMTWLEPFTQSYEVKTAAKMLCADVIKFEREDAIERKRGRRAFSDPKKITTSFVERLRRAGVKFNNDDLDADCGAYLNKDEPHCFSYSYELDGGANEHVCTIHVRYATDTPPALIGQVLQELPHLKIQHHIDMIQRVKKDF